MYEAEMYLIQIKKITFYVTEHMFWTQFQIINEQNNFTVPLNNKNPHRMILRNITSKQCP